jgi:hypothetical protein
MNFANPHGFWFALLAIPIAALYLRRLAADRVTVPTGFLWEEVLAAHPRQAAWRRWRTRASAAVQIAILLLLVLALALPYSRAPLRLALIFDNTAADSGRLAAAKQEALELVARMEPRDQVAVLSAGDHVCTHATLSGDRRRLEEAIGKVALPSGSADPNAVTVARQIVEGMGSSVRGYCPGDPAEQKITIGPDRPWWLYLAGAALALLAIEWPLQQRRWLV